MGNDNRFRAEQETAAELSALRRELPLLRAALVEADDLLSEVVIDLTLADAEWADKRDAWRERNKSMLDRERRARRKHEEEQARRRANPTVRYYRRMDAVQKSIDQQEYEEWLAHPNPRVEVWRTVNGQRE